MGVSGSGKSTVGKLVAERIGGIFIDGDVLHHSADRLSCREPYNPWLLKCTGGRYRYDA